MHSNAKANTYNIIELFKRDRQAVIQKHYPSSVHSLTVYIVHKKKFSDNAIESIK